MENRTSETPGATSKEIMQKITLETRIRKRANWFFWIAGLSMINSLATLFGANFAFDVGLGITQVVDGILNGLSKNLGGNWSPLRIIDLAIDICIAGVFFIIGMLGKKQMRWPITVGMILYVIDALILMEYKSYFPAVIHVVALIGIWGCFNSIKDLNNLEKSWGSQSVMAAQSWLSSMQPQTAPAKKQNRWILGGLLFLITGVILGAVALYLTSSAVLPGTASRMNLIPSDLGSDFVLISEEGKDLYSTAKDSDIRTICNLTNTNCTQSIVVIYGSKISNQVSDIL
jgi:hypothetical protein